ncbi:diguanylate cyclase domain-containing protein [Curvivirga sp.]|uniref:sensor domain-containing diguanylate cyclase n=1 Tax=Curvivirga sp. TaxID=2856848 RepID=UPI003B597A3C
MTEQHEIKKPIKFKISILIAVMLLVVTSISAVSSYIFFWEEFQKLEQQDADLNRDRIRIGFFDKLETLHLSALHLSSANDTYSFVKGMFDWQRESYIKSYLTKATFWNNNIDVMIFMNLEEEAVWAKEFNSDTGMTHPVNEDILSFYKSFKPFSKAGKYGLYVKESRVFMASTRPIFRSNSLGERIGYLTVMRAVDTEFINAFNVEFGSKITVKVIPKNVPTLKNLKPKDGWGQFTETDERVSFFNISSLNSDYIVNINVYSEREITRKAQLAVLWNAAVILAGMALVFFGLLKSLDFIVVTRLKAMAKTILNIGQEENHRIRLNDDGQDEVSLIAHEVNKMQDRILELALNDHLTNLPNRRLFEDRMASALERGRRENTHVSLLFLDLNGFKTVNDTLGHQVGDELLVRVARRLKSITRATDSLARLGGDEFGLIMELNPDEDLQAIDAVCEKIVTTLERPFLIQDKPINISTSIGISIYPDHAEDATTMIRYADIAMYASKAMKNSKDPDNKPWRYFTSEMEIKD